MNKQPLYKSKKFTSWNIKRVAEAFYNEWGLLNPTINPGTVTAYSDKVTLISFKGEVTVTVDVARDKYSNKDTIEIALLVSLSPDPNSLSTHVSPSQYNQHTV